MLRPLVRVVARIPHLWLIVLSAFCLEALLHVRSYRVPRPSRPLDAPFHAQCQEPNATAPRANAAIVMLAQNKDTEKAVESIRSLEKQFNRWFHYPIVFVNDGPWEDEFVKAVSAAASGEAIFEVIPRQQWGFPEWMEAEEEDARASIAAQGAKGIVHAGKESYHHMCRFYSGAFYDLEALKPYKWFWRIEPGIAYTCAITYDPFVEMARNGKRFGYTIALWEVGRTAPGLFRAVSDYKAARRIKSTVLWKSMVDASWLPYPFRGLLSVLASRDAAGDAWNLCHYWNNFEIADLDFFRSREYREFFDYLDRKGGFYYERWGDAPIHSLAAALFLQPEEIHYFEDFGYTHTPFWTCPANALGGQLPDSEALGKLKLTPETEGREGGIGCRCECPTDEPLNFGDMCTHKLNEWSRPRK